MEKTLKHDEEVSFKGVLLQGKKQTNVSPEWNQVEPEGLVIQVMSHAGTSKGTHAVFYYLLSSSQSKKLQMRPVTL